MTTLLGNYTYRARKQHRCWNCGGTIAPGTTYVQHACVNDGQAYRLKMHVDCEKAAQIFYADNVWDFPDGWPPMLDYLQEESRDERKHFFDRLRGHFPHVVCRLEFRLDRLGRL